MPNVNYLRRWFRENEQEIRKAAEDKFVGNIDFDLCAKLDSQLTAMLTSVSALNTRRKALQGRQVDQATRDEARAVSAELKVVKQQIEDTSEALLELCLQMPNIAWSGAPVGADDTSNVELRSWGGQPELTVDHHNFVKETGWVDFDGARRVAGSRAYAVKNGLALLEQALHMLALEKAIAEGFTPVITPTLCLAESFVASGWFPGGREEVYKLENSDLHLAGTSEVPLLGLHLDEVLDAGQLPILYAGMSPCYRSEAGSAGRDTKGLLRVHEFRKVELFVICKDDDEMSAMWHERLLQISESLLQALEIPYRVIEACTGDMGLGKFRMNDIEVWVPSQNRYRESNSCSTLHTWQCLRASIRYRSEKGTRFPHTLNNTAIATPRLLAALIENHTDAHGNFHAPGVLSERVGNAYGEHALSLIEGLSKT